MRRGPFWLFGLIPLLAAAGPGAPIQWTADGRWFAYTVAGPAERVVPPPGWLFVKPQGGTPPSAPAPPGPRRFRLQVGDATTGATIVLEDGASALTSPGWSPDGHMLAFGRWTSVRPEGPRYEVVIQDGLSRQRVVFSRPAVAGEGGVAAGLSSRAVAWSPDARYLAVPEPSEAGGLFVIRADNGRVLKTVPGVSFPAWSPDATKLAMLTTGQTSSLVVMDTSFGPSRVLAELGQAMHPPCWSRDGRSILAVSRRVVDRGRFSTQMVDLLRVQVEMNQVETVAQLASDPPNRPKPLRGVSVSADRDVEDLFSTVEFEGEPSSVVWFRPRTMETVSRFHPFGEVTMRVGSLSLSPNSKSLAVRFGPDDASGIVGLWDTESKRLTPPEPDDAARLEWITLLVESAQKLLAAGFPNPTVDGRAVGRPTLLPVPGELPTGQEIQLRLRRIGTYGRPLCDRPPGSAGVDLRLDDFLAEARLFFDVLREDYSAALASLDAVESRTSSSDWLLRLLAVRAQVYLGLGDRERAGDVIAYLRSLDERVPSRYERTVAGVVLTPLPTATNGWARYLSHRLDDQTKGRRRRSGGDERPFRNRGPIPFQGFEPQFRFGPPGMIAPPNGGAVIEPGPMIEPAEEPDIRVRFRPRAQGIPVVPAER